MSTSLLEQLRAKLTEAHRRLDEAKEASEMACLQQEACQREFDFWLAAVDGVAKDASPHETVPLQGTAFGDESPPAVASIERLPRGTMSVVLSHVSSWFHERSLEEAHLADMIGVAEKRLGRDVPPSTMRAALDRSPSFERVRRGVYRLKRKSA